MKIGTFQRRFGGKRGALSRTFILIVLLALVVQTAAATGFCGPSQCCCSAQPTHNKLAGNHQIPSNACTGNSPCCTFQTDLSRSDVIPAIVMEPHKTGAFKSIAIIDRSASFEQDKKLTRPRTIRFHQPPGPSLPIYHLTSALLC